MSDDPDAFLLFAAHEEFNPGVVGLAASRLTEVYYRPAIVAAQKCGGDARLVPFDPRIPHHRRARSLQGFARPSWRSCGAAGFTVKNENLPELVSTLKEIAREQLSSKTSAKP